MNDKCFEIGTIQAFLDGETSPDLSFRISGHVADCDRCALVLAESEEESSVVFSVLDREFNSMVPTQRLWGSINDAISYEKSHTTFLDKVRVSLSTLFANPSITVAASVLLVFGIFAALWSLKPTGVNNAVGSEVASVAQQHQEIARVDIVGGDTAPIQVPQGGLTVIESKLPAGELKKLVTNASFKPATDEVRAQPAVLRTSVDRVAAEEYLPGEESYVRTIADLKQNVDGQKDRIMNPSSRIAYERDMAVVNDAITKMKEVVKKNPTNQSAKQVLYSSYQNKIDLLNSVVEREELMVSLR